MKKIIYCTLILCFAWISNAYSTPLTAEHLYFFAKQKRLNYLAAYSKYINITNKNNDTALCIAIKSNDYDAYQMLLKYGASTRVNCLANIRKSYNNTRVNGNTSNNNATFLGMGKTGWLTTSAVVAVGAGVAAAAGGGGGGGSRNNSSDNTDTPSIPSVPNCVNGNLVNNKCVCNEGWQGNTCEEAESCPYNTTSCTDGYEETGNTCKSGNITYKECKEKDCSAYETSCGIDYDATEACLSGTTKYYTCTLKICSEEHMLYNGECVKIEEDLIISTNHDNTNNDIVLDNQKYHRNIYGIKSSPTYGNVIYEKHYGDFNSSISINNEGISNIYGIYGTSVYGNYVHNTSDSNAKNTITIKNKGLGNIYGIYSETSYAYGNYLAAYRFGYDEQVPDYNSLSNIINLTNEGDGNVYGIYGIMVYGNKSISGRSDKTDALDEKYINFMTNTITINNIGSGYIYGMYGKDIYSSYGTNIYNTMSNSIDITSTDGIAFGMYGTNSIYNAHGDTIKIHSTSGTAVGIYGTTGTNITNNGTITITNAETGYGIYHEGNGGSIINSGTIDVSAINAYGIFVEDGTDTIVENTGIIKLNGVECTGDCSGTVTNGNYIVLNGATLLNSGTMSANSLNLDNMGGEVVATSSSSFIAENDISGDLSISNNVVTDGFDTTYTVSDMIKAGDSSKLNLVSQSAMFDASLKNGKDAVMTMKSFNDVIENKSLANFLQKNYAMQNNEKLFSNIKSAENIKSLNNFTDQMFGKDMFSRFAFEDLMIMRELNFDINNKLFNNKEDYLSIGGNKSSFAFSGNSRYSLSTVKNGKNSIGISVAFSDINSDDGNKDNRRHDKMYNISMPMGYQANGLKFVSTPRVGYSYGTYDRNGFDNQSYEGTVEKQMFAFMNEARYPLQIGGWNIAPSAELNFINYRISGHETDKEYSLKIKSQNNYSIEAGIGLYASKETKFTKDSSLRFNGGVALYHEFADPYKMKLGMEGMSGTFTLRDENRSDNRAVVQSEIEFKHNNFSIVGNIASYINRKYETNTTLDFKFGF